MAKHVPGRKVAPTLKARVARNIAARRQTLGWTQEELATAAGINPETVSRYERGKSLPSLEALERLAEAMGIDLGQLAAATPSEAPDDARLVASWLKGLAADDRGFVTALIDSTVRHLKQRGSG